MSSSLDASADFTPKNCLNIDEFLGEFNKSYHLNSSSIELDDNEKCHKGEARKRSFMEMENGEEEQRGSLDLNLSLTPLGLLQQKDLCGNQSEISSTSSCMPVNLDSSSSEEVEFSNKTIEDPSLILMGCSHCLIYVMVSEINPKCPKCNSSILIDIFRHRLGKKSRKT
ncbi:hypothetical protein QUC31_006193 [Theobroma cacao]|nr:PREDICTED: uncharacterized protein LOC18586826 [Theobroma cacao]